MKAAFITNNKPIINYVFAPEQLAQLKQLVDVEPEIITSDNLAQRDVADIDILISSWGIFVPPETEMSRFKNLKVLFHAAGATDGFFRAFDRHGVKVVSAWLANSIPVAEFCVSQIILGLKNYFNVTRNLHSPERWNNKITGPGCYGEKVTLIGAGSIARRVQSMLQDYEVKVEVIPSRKNRRTTTLEEAFATSQVISNHLPNRDDNQGVLDGKLFASMRPNAVFINTGRGQQVKEDELIDVLKQRPDLSAVLDVTDPEPPEKDSELYTLPNVFLTPHIAGSLNDEVHRMAKYIIDDLSRYLANEPLKYQVDESMLITSR